MKNILRIAQLMVLTLPVALGQEDEPLLHDNQGCWNDQILLWSGVFYLTTQALYYIFDKDPGVGTGGGGSADQASSWIAFSVITTSLICLVACTFTAGRYLHRVFKGLWWLFYVILAFGLAFFIGMTPIAKLASPPQSLLIVAGLAAGVSFTLCFIFCRQLYGAERRVGVTRVQLEPPINRSSDHLLEEGGLPSTSAAEANVDGEGRGVAPGERPSAVQTEPTPSEGLGSLVEGSDEGERRELFAL